MIVLISNLQFDSFLIIIRNRKKQDGERKKPIVEARFLKIVELNLMSVLYNDVQMDQ